MHYKDTRNTDYLTYAYFKQPYLIEQGQRNYGLIHCSRAAPRAARTRGYLRHLAIYASVMQNLNRLDI